MKGLTFLLAILINHSEGAMDIVFKHNNATIGVAVIITCTKSSSLVGSVTWYNDRYTTTVISNCFHTIDLCTPSISTVDDRYVFTSDIANKEFTMIITKVEQADEGVYTCKDLNEEGKATLQVQTGKTKEKTKEWTPLKEWCNRLLLGGTILAILAPMIRIFAIARENECVNKLGSPLLFLALILIIIGSAAGIATGSCTIWWRIVLICVAVFIFLGYLFHLDYLPGWYSNIYNYDGYDVFDDNMKQHLLKRVTVDVAKELDKNADELIKIGNNTPENNAYKIRTGANISMCGNNQPYIVTACLKIKVKRAVKKMEKIFKDAISSHNSVPIPQEDYQVIKFEEVLNHSTLERVEQQTDVKVMMYGQGSSKYGKYGQPLLQSDIPLQVSITSDKPGNVKNASAVIYDIIDTAITDATSKNKHHQGRHQHGHHKQEHQQQGRHQQGYQ